MAIREVVKNPDPILRKVCRPVENFDEKLAQLLDDMKDTMYDMDGCGLAAPQIGILRRICVIDVGDGAIELVNPRIIKASGSQNESEGCLSCPGVWGVTDRPRKVKVRFFDRYGDEYEIAGDGLLARALCHEIDHLDGILFMDKVISFQNEG